MLTIEKLQEFGVDTKEGLTRCMNMEAFYFKMIKMGLSDGHFESLGASLEAGNLEEAFEAAHALKGVIGNLALSPIYEPLAEMTEMLRAGKEADYITMYKPIKEMRDELYERLCSGEIQSSSWIEAWMRIQKRKKTETGIWDVRADNLFEIVCALRFAPTIASLWCGLHRYSLTGFMDSYLRMVLFDLLLRQKDRTASNYGLIINSESRTACLSPLFDNGTLDKPYMAENEMALNGLIFCADCLPEAIYQMCGNSVRSVMEEFLQYGTAADLPCQNQIKHRILTGLEIIRDGLKEYTAKWTV